MKRVLVFTLAAAAATAFAARAAEPAAPEVTRKGRTVVSYKGPSVELVLGYRWTNANPKATWVPLQLALSGATANAVEIAREDVSLVKPSGERVPLPTQKAWIEGIGDPRRILQALHVTRDPIADYFPGRTEDQPLAFFVEPGHGISYDRVNVTYRTLTWGLLWFPLPEGVLPGTYTLEIRNKWVQAEVPFTVPAPPLATGAKDPGW